MSRDVDQDAWEAMERAEERLQLAQKTWEELGRPLLVVRPSGVTLRHPLVGILHELEGDLARRRARVRRRHRGPDVVAVVGPSPASWARSWYYQTVTHEQALASIRATIEGAAGPVSIAVVDDHGEVVACLAMDGAARDTLENARRKAYTAARSDATSTRALAEKVQGSPTELASFDPRFSFFHGGVAAFSGSRRVGAVGVSGLPGAEDERLALAAIAAAGLEARI